MKKARLIDGGFGVAIQETASPFRYGEAKRRFFSTKVEARAYFDKFASLSSSEREKYFGQMVDEDAPDA